VPPPSTSSTLAASFRSILSIDLTTTYSRVAVATSLTSRSKRAEVRHRLEEGTHSHGPRQFDALGGGNTLPLEMFRCEMDNRNTSKYLSTAFDRCEEHKDASGGW
jgi:hypothetical protein